MKYVTYGLRARCTLHKEIGENMAYASDHLMKLQQIITSIDGFTLLSRRRFLIELEEMLRKMDMSCLEGESIHVVASPVGVERVMTVSEFMFARVWTRKMIRIPHLTIESMLVLSFSEVRTVLRIRKDGDSFLTLTIMPGSAPDARQYSICASFDTRHQDVFADLLRRSGVKKGEYDLPADRLDSTLMPILRGL